MLCDFSIQWRHWQVGLIFFGTCGWTAASIAASAGQGATLRSASKIKLQRQLTVISVRLGHGSVGQISAVSQWCSPVVSYVDPGEQVSFYH